MKKKEDILQELMEHEKKRSSDKSGRTNAECGPLLPAPKEVAAAVPSRKCFLRRFLYEHGAVTSEENGGEVTNEWSCQR